MGLDGPHEDRSVCSSNYCVRPVPLMSFQGGLVDPFPHLQKGIVCGGREESREMAKGLPVRCGLLREAWL